MVQLDGAARWGLMWSPATGELLTTFGVPAPGLVAIDPVTGAMRTIDPDGSDYRLAVSADGSALFYNRDDADSTRALFAGLAPPGAGHPIAACWRNAFGFAGQAPAGLAAYGLSIGDSVTLHDLATDERRKVAEGIPLLFSPDGSQLAHYGVTGGLRILSGGVSTPAGLPRSPYGFELPLGGPRLRWDARGLRMLFVAADYHRLMYVEPFGHPRTIAALGRQGDPHVVIDRTSLVWSPSGRTAAVWCSRSGEGPGFWHDLYFIDVEAGLRGVLSGALAARRVTTVQGITNALLDGPLAISPDDSRLYADIGRTLYEFPVGPVPTP